MSLARPGRPFTGLLATTFDVEIIAGPSFPLEIVTDGSFEEGDEIWTLSERSMGGDAITSAQDGDWFALATDTIGGVAEQVIDLEEVGLDPDVIDAEGYVFTLSCWVASEDTDNTSDLFVLWGTTPGGDDIGNNNQTNIGFGPFSTNGWEEVTIGSTGIPSGARFLTITMTAVNSNAEVGFDNLSVLVDEAP